MQLVSPPAKAETSRLESMKILFSTPFSVRVILVLGMLVSLVGISRYVLISKNPSNAASRSQSTILPQKDKVVALGRLEPEGEVVSVAGPSGERVARLEVSEGEFVKAGQVLAYLESYNERLAQRDLAATQLAETQNQLRTDTLLQRVEIEQARVQITQVDTPELLQAQSQKAVIQRLQVELADAIRTRDRFKQLYHDGGISQQVFDEKQLAVSRSQENLNQAKATLNQLVEARNANIRLAQTNLNHAYVNLQRSNSHSEIQSVRQRLKLAEAQMERTIIRSPKSGQVLKIFAHPGEAIFQQAILKLGHTQQMYAVAEVYETDVRQLKLDQHATVTSPALAEPITGTVTQIGRLVYKNNIIGDDPAAASDARVVEVKIRLDRSKLVSGFSNLQVDIQIDVNPSKDGKSLS